MISGSFTPHTARALRAEEDARSLSIQLTRMQDRLNLVLENITVDRQGDDLNIGVRIGDGYDPARKTTARERAIYIKRIDAVLYAREVWGRK